MKVLKKSAIWIVLVIYLVLAFGFIRNKYKLQKCTAVNVVIADSLMTAFIVPEDIEAVLRAKGINCKGTPLKDIQLSKIEETITRNQIIDQCRAFTEINGTLTIEISQRSPLVRVIEENGKGYYLDREGNVLNLSNRYSPHILIANGHLSTSVKVGTPVNVRKDKKNEELSVLRDIYRIAEFIYTHPLWKAQFVQLYVNEQHEFELVPRIGPHLIVLGSAEDYEEKFENLELLYREGLSHTGWNQYREINLKYKGQIVCTKI
ncbi:MAG: hypothetical protein JW801_18700 [Bacteroidales bacterium]|nr:hypothetical protein [Bacteroidales bacterium]